MPQNTARYRILSESTPSREKPSAYPAQRPAGKIVHDSRGTAIWDWSEGNGVPGVTTSTGVLRMLDEPALEIEGAQPDRTDWEGDPYNRGLAPR